MSRARVGWHLHRECRQWDARTMKAGWGQGLSNVLPLVASVPSSQMLSSNCLKCWMNGKDGTQAWQQKIRQEPSSPKGWVAGVFPDCCWLVRNKQLALKVSYSTCHYSCQENHSQVALGLKMIITFRVCRVSYLLKPKWVGINELEMS